VSSPSTASSAAATRPAVYDLKHCSRKPPQARFNARRTMRLAQQLYEGLNIGRKAASVSSATCVRTRIASSGSDPWKSESRDEALRQGEVADERVSIRLSRKTRRKPIEAIRPTSASITPASLEGKIQDDHYRLYSLIWKRAVASQMNTRYSTTVAVDMLAALTDQASPTAGERLTLVKPGYIS